MQISDKIDNYDLGAFDADNTIDELTESALEHIPPLPVPPMIAEMNRTIGVQRQAPVPPPAPADPSSKTLAAAAANNGGSLRNMRSNSLPVNWQTHDCAHPDDGSAYRHQFAPNHQRPYPTANLFNANCSPMQQRHNGGRYSYSSNQDFVNYNHNYINFRPNNNAAGATNNTATAVANNNGGGGDVVVAGADNAAGQHYQNCNGGQFREQNNAVGSNGYYNNNNNTNTNNNNNNNNSGSGSGNTNNNSDVYLQRFHRSTAAADGMAAYNNGGYYGGCADGRQQQQQQQCGQQQCGQQQCAQQQQHGGSYYGNGGYQNKFAGGYSRTHQQHQQQHQIQHQHQHQHQNHHQQQQQHQYYVDLDGKRRESGSENIAVAADPFQQPLQVPPVCDGGNNMVLKDMSTSLSSLYDENTFFQMSTVFSES